MDYDSLVYACAYRTSFGDRLIAARQMLHHFGSFEKIFSLTASELSELLKGQNCIIEKLTDPLTLDNTRKEVDRALSLGIEIIPITDTKYPVRFKECDDASSVLFYRGNADLNSERILSIVGTRRCTCYGKNVCKSIIESLSHLDIKPLIVSGLAYGIDECAHLSALESGLSTIAVLPGSIQRIYPAGHTYLAEIITENGGLLTDILPPSYEIKPFSFPRRNRIIAGISDATLLVESYKKGGGLITAAYAASYNREVFAVPGRIDDKSFEGCNNLILKNGASIIQDSFTISETLGWNARPKKLIPEPDLFSDINDPLKKKVIEILVSQQTVRAEELLLRTGYDIGQISSTLIQMEIDGLIEIVSGDRYAMKMRI